MIGVDCAATVPSALIWKLLMAASNRLALAVAGMRAPAWAAMSVIACRRVFALSARA
jgi:hypothetical protein